MTRTSGGAVITAPLDAPRTAVALVGQSPEVCRVRAALETSESPCTLIEAEPGLEVAEVARSLHARRSSGPFVAVECARVGPGAVERELFGVARTDGAETEVVDATSALARANGGTLYLGDVNELSAVAQSRLARVIRDGEISVSGAVVRVELGLVGSVLVDSTLTAHTRLRRELQRHFGEGAFVIPPLRHRPEDLPALVEQLMASNAPDQRRPGLVVTQPAMTLLAAMPWRGNVDELRRAMARLTRTVTGGAIRLEDVLTHVHFDGRMVPDVPVGSLRTARQQFERDYIAMVIRHHRGHIAGAARALGIQRTNLYRKARQLGFSVGKQGQT